MTAPVISHWSILWSGVKLWPRDLFVCCSNNNLDRSGPTSSRGGDGDSPLHCGAIWKLQTGRTRRESFLSHILVSTSSFVGDDEALSKTCMCWCNHISMLRTHLIFFFLPKWLLLVSLVCSDVNNNQIHRVWPWPEPICWAISGHDNNTK